MLSKKIMWKFIAVFFITILFLFGCSDKGKEASGDNNDTEQENGNNKPDNNNNDNDTDEGNSDDYDPNKEVELEWLTYQYGEVADDAPIKTFLEEEFNVKFNIWNLDVNERDSMLGTRLSGGDIPDIMTVYSDNELAKFYEQGIVTTFTKEELEEYMPNYKALIDSHDPDIWNYAERDGEYIGIPSLNLPDGLYTKPVVYQKAWLDHLGVSETPTTLEEFEELMYRFRNDDPNNSGKKDTYGLSDSAFMNVYGAYGIYPEFWALRDGEVVWSGILPETKEALKTLSKWKADDIIAPEWVTGENTGGYWAISNAFVNGEIGVSSLGEGYHWAVPQSEGGFKGQNIEALEAATGGEGEVVFGQPPVGPEGEFGNILGGMKGPAYLAFGSNAADPNKKYRIMEILDTIYGDYETYLFVRNGEKGTHWDLNEDGVTIEQKDGFQSPEELANIGGHITFAPFGQPDFGAKNARKEDREFSEKNFLFEGAGHENVVKAGLPSEAKYMDNLIKLQQETFTKIINGSADIDEFDAFVEDWLEEGGEELTKEANEWYQETVAE